LTFHFLLKKTIEMSVRMIARPSLLSSSWKTSNPFQRRLNLNGFQSFSTNSRLCMIFKNSLENNHGSLRESARFISGSGLFSSFTSSKITLFSSYKQLTSQNKCPQENSYCHRFSSSFHSSSSTSTASTTNTSLSTESNSRDIYQKEWFLYSSFALAVLIPVAFVLSPSVLNKPVDALLMIAIPFHGHLGLSVVIEDYCHGNFLVIMKGLQWVITVVTVLGFFGLLSSGVGIVEPIKSLWRKPKQETSEKKPANHQ